MLESVDQVMKLVQEELIRVYDDYGVVHNSIHESYAVLKEEVEESADNLDTVQKHLNLLWGSIKQNGPVNIMMEDLDVIEREAVFLACEAIQVAAMAVKSRNTLKIKGVD